MAKQLYHHLLLSHFHWEVILHLKVQPKSWGAAGLLFYTTYFCYIFLRSSRSWGGADTIEILFVPVRSETNSAVLAAHIKSVEITIMMVSTHPLFASPSCQRQQGPRPPGSTSVSLTHMAQAACFFSFSPRCHTLVRLPHVLHLSLLHCVTCCTTDGAFIAPLF